METKNRVQKMFDALEMARDFLLPQCNGGTAFAKGCSHVVNRIMDALAEQPRNCDRFNTATEAMDALKRIHHECAENNHPCREDCPDCGKEKCAIAWLFGKEA